MKRHDGGMKDSEFHLSIINRTCCCTSSAILETQTWITSSRGSTGEILLDPIVDAIINNDASESFAIPRALGRRDFSSKGSVSIGGSTLSRARITTASVQETWRRQYGPW